MLGVIDRGAANGYFARPGFLQILILVPGLCRI
jgi:hypothetical protein